MTINTVLKDNTTNGHKTENFNKMNMGRGLNLQTISCFSVAVGGAAKSDIKSKS